ncbi:MAG: hypothetical protein VYE68_03300, partial [Acidobacteriota bacterium]|nr:hypothetical protein [Acidobacteriota bacterium]
RLYGTHGPIPVEIVLSNGTIRLWRNTRITRAGGDTQRRLCGYARTRGQVGHVLLPWLVSRSALAVARAGTDLSRTYPRTLLACRNAHPWPVQGRSGAVGEAWGDCAQVLADEQGVFETAEEKYKGRLLNAMCHARALADVGIIISDTILSGSENFRYDTFESDLQNLGWADGAPGICEN